MSNIILRVRRAELNASDESTWSGSDDGLDADLEAKLNAQIASALGIDTSASDLRGQASEPGQVADQLGDDTVPLGAEPVADEDDGQEEFAFRLFSTTNSVPKVVLEDDSEPRGEGGLVTPGRPLSYYVVTNLPESKRQEYRFAAMTGDEVFARSRCRSWGLELPWKVITASSITRKASAEEKVRAAGGEAEDGKRRRPGKKRRIALRQKVQARADKEKAQAQKLLEKEEHIKDKKKRLNRLKKLRKRAKNKEQKLASKGAEAGSQADSDEESATSS